MPTEQTFDTPRVLNVGQQRAILNSLESTDRALKRDSKKADGSLKANFKEKGKTNHDIAKSRDQHIAGLERSRDMHLTQGRPLVAERFAIQARFERASGNAEFYANKATHQNDFARRAAAAKEDMAAANFALAKFDVEVKTQWEKTAQDRSLAHEANMAARRLEVERMVQAERVEEMAQAKQARIETREANYQASILPGSQPQYLSLVDDVRQRFAKTHGEDVATYVMSDRERAMAHSLVVDQKYGQMGPERVQETPEAIERAKTDPLRQVASRASAEARERSLNPPPSLSQPVQAQRADLGLTSLRSIGLMARQEQDRIVYVQASTNTAVVTEYKSRLVAGDEANKSAELRAATLAAAAEKFPNGFSVRDMDPEVNRQWAQTAVEMGIADRIKNPEMQEFIRDAAEALERQEPRETLEAVVELEQAAVQTQEVVNTESDEVASDDQEQKAGLEEVLAATARAEVALAQEENPLEERLADERRADERLEADAVVEPELAAQEAQAASPQFDLDMALESGGFETLEEAQAAYEAALDSDIVRTEAADQVEGEVHAPVADQLEAPEAPLETQESVEELQVASNEPAAQPFESGEPTESQAPQESAETLEATQEPLAKKPAEPDSFETSETPQESAQEPTWDTMVESQPKVQAPESVEAQLAPEQAPESESQVAAVAPESESESRPDSGAPADKVGEDVDAPVDAPADALVQPPETAQLERDQAEPTWESLVETTSEVLAEDTAQQAAQVDQVAGQAHDAIPADAESAPVELDADALAYVQESATPQQLAQIDDIMDGVYAKVDAAESVGERHAAVAEANVAMQDAGLPCNVVLVDGEGEELVEGSTEAMSESGGESSSAAESGGTDLSMLDDDVATQLQAVIENEQELSEQVEVAAQSHGMRQ